MNNSMDWTITGRIHTIIDGWDSSRQFPTFVIPWYYAPTVEDAHAKAKEILNPYGIFSGNYELFQVGTGRVVTGNFDARRNSDIYPMPEDSGWNYVAEHSL